MSGAVKTWTCQCYTLPTFHREVVFKSDYAALLAERDALREQNQRLQDTLKLHEHPGKVVCDPEHYAELEVAQFAAASNYEALVCAEASLASLVRCVNELTENEDELDPAETGAQAEFAIRFRVARAEASLAKMRARLRGLVEEWDKREPWLTGGSLRCASDLLVALRESEGTSPDPRP